MITRNLADAKEAATLEPQRWASRPVWRKTERGPRQFITLPPERPGGPLIEVPVKWTPQKHSQKLFLQCPLMEVLLEGGRGTGKTDCLLVDFLQHVGLGYGEAWQGILFRRSYKQLEDAIKKSKAIFKEAYPTARFIGGAPNKWIFPTGEELKFRVIKKDIDYEEFHGFEFTWIGWEELCQWASLGAYKRMFSTLRSSHPGVIVDGKLVPIPLKVRATANPYGVGHNLVRQRWELPEGRGRILSEVFEMKDESEITIQRTAIHSRYEENMALRIVQPNYMAQILMAAKNEAERRAWEFGDWDICAGGMFDGTWRGEVHVIDEFDIPPSWQLDRSFDWGWSKPFSVLWWAQSDGMPYVKPDGTRVFTVRGDLFLVADWYGCVKGSANEGLHMIDTDIARGVLERQTAMFGDRFVRPGPADGHIYDAVNTQSIAETMADEGCQWTKFTQTPGSRILGWARIRDLLVGAMRPDAKPREKPGLFIFRRCKEWIRTVPSLPRDEIDQDNVPKSAEDHAGDSTRYRVLYKADEFEESRLHGR